MFPILQIGPLAIQTPGLILILGLWVGLYYSEKLCSKKGFDPGSLYTLSFMILAAGVAGGRIAYALQYPQAFLKSPLSLLSFSPSMLDFWGAMGMGLIAALFYGQRHRLELWLTLDIFTPALAVLMLALGFSHLASGSAYGAETNLPWAIELWGGQRHPTQLLEIFFASLGLGLVYRLVKANRKAANGMIFLPFLAFTSANRLFWEAFRGDSQLIGNLRLAQVVAWLIFAGSLYLIIRRQKNSKLRDVPIKD